MVKRQGLALGVAVGAFVGLIGAGIMMPRQTTRTAEARTTSPYWERASSGVVYYNEGGVVVKQGLPNSQSICPTNAGYSFQNDGCYDTGIFSTGDGDLRLYSNNIMGLKVASNGRVGIRTTTPDAQLDLEDGSAAGSKFLLIGDDAYLTDLDQANTLGIYGNQDSREGKIQFGSGGAKIKGQSNGDMCIGTGC